MAVDVLKLRRIVPDFQEFTQRNANEWISEENPEATQKITAGSDL